MRRNAQRGQTGTEYMLVVSVVVLAIVLAGYGFVPSFRSGVDRLGADVERMLSTGQRTRRAAPRYSAPNYSAPELRLPMGPPNTGCAGGTACNPTPPSSGPLGLPRDVCRGNGSNC